MAHKDLPADAPIVPAQPARRVELHRRVAVIRPGKIHIRPSRRAMFGPLTGFLLGLGACVVIWFGMGSLPLLVLALLLLFAVVVIPLSGTGLVYSLIGAHVVIDAEKGSATWQQGMIGLGLGTEELVPFAKIAAITVEEAGEATGRPTEELAQWQIVLEKVSGKRLVVGGLTAPRSLAKDALAPALELANAIGEVTGAPVRAPVIEQPRAQRTPQQHRRTRRGRRHGARR
jgi:hypothetical protein